MNELKSKIAELDTIIETIEEDEQQNNTDSRFPSEATLRPPSFLIIGAASGLRIDSDVRSHTQPGPG